MQVHQPLQDLPGVALQRRQRDACRVLAPDEAAQRAVCQQLSDEHQHLAAAVVPPAGREGQPPHGRQGWVDTATTTPALLLRRRRAVSIVIVPASWRSCCKLTRSTPLPLQLATRSPVKEAHDVAVCTQEPQRKQQRLSALPAQSRMHLTAEEQRTKNPGRGSIRHGRMSGHAAHSLTAPIPTAAAAAHCPSGCCLCCKPATHV